MFKNKLTYTRLIAMSFFFVILTGSILLTFPFCSRTGTYTPYEITLFTATSATCVTGLVMVDTFTHWSVIGQVIILTLIQIGGLGFMTIITMLSIFLKRKISLHERKILMQSAGTIRIGGIVKLIKRICLGTLIFEGVGAILLSFKFVPRMGLLRGIYNGIFHSVSAFCNAGFDLMGRYEKFSSFTQYHDDLIINLTITGLIVIGGIGFLVWNDIIKNKFNLRKYELHSKIVIFTTFILIVLGMVLFFVFEANDSMKGYNVGDRILMSLFQSVTPRTAGFNTIDLTKLSESGRFLTVILMLIGGSPGSTAGGIKTTTLMVLILGAISSSRHSNGITIFRRRLQEDVVKQASAIFTIYIFAVLVATMAICAIEPISAEVAAFEVASAIGTVGLSLSATPTLGLATHLILIILMFGGRVGGLSLMLVLAEKAHNVQIERPVEKILLG